MEKLYEIRDKYSEKYPNIKKEKNFFDLLKFFDIQKEQIESKDIEIVDNIKKAYGKTFPDIPELYSKMNKFLSSINDYFLEKAKNGMNKKT